MTLLTIASCPDFRKPEATNHRGDSGFSLLEMVTVLVLLGVIGVFALGRFADSDGFAARGLFDDTVNALRFAQKLAISSGCDVRVTLGNGYALNQRVNCTGVNFSVPVQNPADRANNYQAVYPAGFSLTAGTIIFDARGLCPGCAAPYDEFTVAGGPLPYRFRVHAATGLVEVI